MDYQDKKLRSRTSSLGLILIGLFSIGYCLFSAPFAEFHIDLPFLDFPIFVGEILLFLCLILLFIGWKDYSFKINVYSGLLIFYIGFVLIKAFWGYSVWGPLSFRHAALFYYPAFALFGYFFYRKDFFTNKKKIIIALLLIAILGSPFLYIYSLISCFLLAFILIKSLPYKFFKFLLFILLLLIVPYEFIFQSSRTALVSSIVVIIYLYFVLVSTLRVRKIYKFIYLFLVVAVIGTGAMNPVSRSKIKSLTNFSEMISRYNKYTGLISNKESSYKPEKIKVVKLYGEEKDKLSFLNLKKRAELREKVIAKNRISNKLDSTVRENISQGGESFGGYLDTDYNNILFRIFIWQDMLEDLKTYKRVIGFNFGKPLRSKRIEILGWAKGDWASDGWITAHNSYLQIIYRTGIVGILLIGALLGAFINMVSTSIKKRSITGILLCGALLYWLTAANFLVILEFPYNAIPFWSLFGMTFAYLWRKNKTDENINNSQPLA